MGSLGSPFLLGRACCRSRKGGNDKTMLVQRFHMYFNVKLAQR